MYPVLYIQILTLLENTQNNVAIYYPKSKSVRFLTQKAKLRLSDHRHNDRYKT